MSLNTINKRINFLGGDTDGRINEGKLRSLKYGIYNAYQDCQIFLQDDENPEVFDREFRALINPDKDNIDYKNMILSIPYEDIQLQIGEEEETMIQSGQVFYWPRTESYWIIYMQHLSERAYFRADIRLCEAETTIDGRNYKLYFRGPDETTIVENQKAGVVWNDLNYSAIVFITKDAHTIDYVKRFHILYINGEPWEIVAHNNVAGDGIIKIALKEAFEDPYKKPEEPKPEPKEIKGELEVYPYEEYTYSIDIENPSGEWSVNSSKIVIISKSATEIRVGINTGKSGKFTLTYTQEDQVISQEIIIKSI